MARIALSTKEGDPDKALRQAKQFLQSKSGLLIRALGVSAEVMATGESRTFEGDKIDFSKGGLATGLTEFGVPIAPQGMVKPLRKAGKKL